MLGKRYKRAPGVETSSGGNLFLFCEIITDLQQIPNQVRDDGYLYFWLDMALCTLCKKMLIPVMKGSISQVIIIIHHKNHSNHSSDIFIMD